MSKIDMKRLQDLTGSASYPLSKNNLLSMASQRGADDEVLSFLRELPQNEYQTQDAVLHDIRELETTYQTGVWRNPKAPEQGI
jgi:hypothetical protein